MAQYIKNANIWGRIGSGVGQGLAEQVPKEIERHRLASGLEDLGNQQNMTPFQQFARLSSLPGITPQMIQSGSDLLRQQAIIDDYRNASKQQNQPDNIQRPNQPQNPNVAVEQKSGIPLASATTTGSTKAALEPYIPPSGPEVEQEARRRMAENPRIYPDLPSARQSVMSEIAANQTQSNALLNKRNLEEDVQNKAEANLQKEIATVGAQVPPTLISKLQQEAVDDVATGKLTPEQAKIKYGQKAHRMSEDFSNIKGWGDFTLITKTPQVLNSSIKSVQHEAKKGGYQKEAADSMIADNGVTPQMAYAQMYPVRDQKDLNHAIKELPDIKSRAEKRIGAGPGLAGIGIRGTNRQEMIDKTRAICPRLASLMGLEGSPLSVSYEIEKKGYDPQVWKDYLIENAELLNLTSNQIKELGKPQPGYFGLMNDWWLKSFTGVE